MDFFFFSSFITPQSIFVTHHSLLKIPQFPIPTRLAHVFSFSSLNFFYFLWDHTWAPCQAFLLAYPPHTISSFHITHRSFPFPFSPQFSPKTRDFNLGIPCFFLFLFFFFFLQPPIPTTTTSILSLKHKPRKFISILEAPRKFTNPQQSIRCPNRWFFYGSKMRKAKRKKIKREERKIGLATISTVTSRDTIYDLVQLESATISQNQAFLFLFFSFFFFPSTPNTHNNHFGSELEAQTQKIH